MLSVAIGAISAAVLAYEVLLVRLFAIVQWHHFAYMAISIALLGFGASGTFVFLARDWLMPRFGVAFAANAVGFGVSAVASFLVAQWLPFNPLALLWEPQQMLALLWLYALLTVPFFCGANCIGLAFVCLGDRIGRVYRDNLIGSGVGALGVVLALFALDPMACLRVVGALGIAAGAIALIDPRAGRRWGGAVILLALAVVAPLAVPQGWSELRLSEYKGLSIALRLPDAEAIGERSSPLGLLTVVRSPVVPFRHVPGLSLTSAVEPPAQLAVFVDGDAPTMITAYDGRRESLAYLDQTTAALPYHLRRDPAVLVLGAGGGADVLQALYHSAPRIDAVELNPQVVRLVRETHAAFAGRIYDDPRVRIHVAEARAFVAASGERWDLIQIPLLDSLAAAAAGAHGLSESYVYTVEAFRDYLRRLNPNGLLAITRWLRLPPRDSLKLFHTALIALEGMGVAQPAGALLMIRGWNTTTLLVKNGPFAAEEIAAARAFADARGFDLAFHVGLRREETDRWNRLDQPFFFDGAAALAGPGRTDFVARYKFDITPATDDRPYFFDFFRWQALPEIARLPPQGTAALLEWGYPILLATLIQAVILSTALILLPLGAARPRAGPQAARRRVGAYFAALGLAFMFIEIAFIQRFILFLGHPLYAAAVVICAFLIAAGAGSGTAPRLDAWLRQAGEAHGRAPGWFGAGDLAIVCIGAVALVYLALLPPLLSSLIALPAPAKVAIALLLIAPLAYWMGMPFPLGLSRLSARMPELVPWAWGVNGCLSVIGTTLATILAIHFGFTIVVGLAVALYAAAGLVLRSLPA